MVSAPFLSSRSVGQMQSDVLPKAQIPTVMWAEALFDSESAQRLSLICFPVENNFQLHWKK